MNNGGPAFARPGSEGFEPAQSGMSLRDYFAAAALPQLIHRFELVDEERAELDGFETPKDTTAGWSAFDRWDDVAVAAYAVADAMLAERERKE